MNKYSLFHFIFLAGLWFYIAVLVNKMIQPGKLPAVNPAVAATPKLVVTVSRMDNEYRYGMSYGDCLTIGRTSGSDIQIDSAGLPLKIGCLRNIGDSITCTIFKKSAAYLNDKSIEIEDNTVALKIGEKLFLSEFRLEIEVEKYEKK